MDRAAATLIRSLLLGKLRFLRRCCICASCLLSLKLFQMQTRHPMRTAGGPSFEEICVAPALQEHHRGLRADGVLRIGCLVQSGLERLLRRSAGELKSVKQALNSSITTLLSLPYPANTARRSATLAQPLPRPGALITRSSLPPSPVASPDACPPAR